MKDQLTILTGVELVVKPAQTIALIGESGSGKSTLLGILAGLDDGTRGDVVLLGQSLSKLNEEARAALRAKNVGFVFQSFMLVPTLNALENVQLPALLRGENDSNSRQQAVQLLEQSWARQASAPSACAAFGRRAATRGAGAGIYR